MKKSWLNSVIIILIVICFAAAGCAKKNLAGNGQEVKSQAAQQTTSSSVENEKAKGEAKVEVPSTAEGIKKLESEDVFFSYDQSTLTPEAKETISRKAAFLKANPNLAVRIEGNCDERGTVEYNLALGDRRASAAQDYLTFLGIAGNRISTVSYGKEKPLDAGHDENAWAKNRRDHFAVVKK